MGFSVSGWMSGERIGFWTAYWRAVKGQRPVVLGMDVGRVSTPVGFQASVAE